jgi:F0F1-type ATP synthase membrane subunit b/b'
MMAEYKEMLGRKFRVVQNGLDANEVTEYLKGEAGSSDGVFRQLEQFSALQVAAKTIDDAIKQARDLAEHAKVKATEEAEQRKTQAIEDGKEIAAKIINEAGKSVLAYFDNASSIMMEAMNETFEKAKEQVTGNRAKIREQIEKNTWAEINKIVTGTGHPARESSNSKSEPTNPSPNDKVTSVASSTSSDPWQDAH